MERFFVLLLMFSMLGCENELQSECCGLEHFPAFFTSAKPPPGSEIAPNETITVTFDFYPVNLTVSAGTVTIAGKTATITGPFTPGPLSLTITWADGTQALNYTVTRPNF